MVQGVESNLERLGTTEGNISLYHPRWHHKPLEVSVTGPLHKTGDVYPLIDPYRKVPILSPDNRYGDAVDEGAGRR